jgi:hypothetical protein
MIEGLQRPNGEVWHAEVDRSLLTGNVPLIAKKAALLNRVPVKECAKSNYPKGMRWITELGRLQ